MPNESILVLQHRLLVRMHFEFACQKWRDVLLSLSAAEELLGDLCQQSGLVYELDVLKEGAAMNFR
jgi:hypothetical protein